MFIPLLNRLPLPQQQLWPTLRGVSDLGFVLYGGTAIAVMLAAGVDLSRALGAASRLFGTNFQPLESLRALNYFRDGDLETLGANDRKILVQATKAVTATLPSVPLLSHRLSAR